MRTRILVDDANFVPYKVADSYIVYGENRWASQPYKYYADRRRVIAMVDVITEDFHRRSRNGEIINNPMWKVSYQRVEMPSNVHGTGTGNETCTYWELNFLPEAGFNYDLHSTPQSAVDALCDLYSSDSLVAQTKAWANIDVSEMQAWASLGEMPETIRMIVDLLKQAFKLTIAAKRGDTKTLLREVKKLRKFDTYADIWLLWRYGIRPLIGDITSLLKVLDAKPIVGKRQTFRGKHTLVYDDVVTNSHVNWSAGGAGWDFKTTERLFATFRAGVMVQIENSINSGLAILGLDNPLEAIWELIPFSFIIDWFVNVGDVISAILLNPSLSPVCSFVTEEVTRTAIVQCTGYSWNNDLEPCQVHSRIHNTMVMTPGYVNTFITAKRRVPLAERYSLPRVRVKMDLAKLTDLALIARKL